MKPIRKFVAVLWFLFRNARKTARRNLPLLLATAFACALFVVAGSLQ